MNASLEKNIDLALVEKLLSLRTVSPDDTPCRETEHIARVIAGKASPEEMETVSAHLSSCDDCREAVLSLGRLTATGAIAPLCDPKVYWTAGVGQRGLRIVSAKIRVIAAAAAVIAVVCGAYFLWTPRGKGITEGSQTLTIKGAEDALFAAVERGITQFTLRPHDRLEVGDRIGLFYSAKRDGYVAVLALDGEGNVTRVYPSEGFVSASIASAERASLSTGALVQEGNGCEWLVAVFSDRPLDLDSLAFAVAKAKHTNVSCGLELQLAGARTVFILPYLL